jgi:hypothetical protein
LPPRPTPGSPASGHSLPAHGYPPTLRLMVQPGNPAQVAQGKLSSRNRAVSRDMRHSSASKSAPLHPKQRGKPKVSTANPAFGRFHLHQIAEAFPESAEILLFDTYLTDEAAVSFRVFRVYRPTPPHYPRP